jgi:hypothetical protein
MNIFSHLHLADSPCSVEIYCLPSSSFMSGNECISAPHSPIVADGKRAASIADNSVFIYSLGSRFLLLLGPASSL